MRSDLPTDMGDGFLIVIDKLKMNMLIGVCDFEKCNPQNVEVSLRVFTNITPSNIAETGYISYADIVETIERKTSELGHIGLVEEYASHIADWVLRDKRVSRVVVEVIKTNILPQTAGVGVIFSRSR